MAVITVSREYRSPGREVAEAAARRLGWKLVDKEFLGALLETCGVAKFAKDYETKLGVWDAFDPRKKLMVTMLGRATLAVARRGSAVILGRGSFALLGGYSDALNVRVQAPLRDRVDHCMAEDGIIDLARAEAAVREGDRVRRSFVETMYGVRWDSASAFDLVVDTSKIDPEPAAALIVEAAAGLSRTAGRASTADIAPDPLFDPAVREAFERS